MRQTLVYCIHSMGDKTQVLATGGVLQVLAEFIFYEVFEVIRSKV